MKWGTSHVKVRMERAAAHRVEIHSLHKENRSERKCQKYENAVSNSFKSLSLAHCLAFLFELKC